jgi:hypothetical protein
VQGVELLAGVGNIALMSLNIRDGVKMTGQVQMIDVQGIG